MLAEIMATITHNRLPSTTSIKRSVSMRKDKVYVDFLQNRPAQTVASAYSVRPKPSATVSAPLKWEEVNHQLTPEMFTIENFTKRLEKVGDLWQPVLGKGISISAALKAIEKLG
jgi:bifunctional non-homologous end joining protein LigD